MSLLHLSLQNIGVAAATPTTPATIPPGYTRNMLYKGQWDSVQYWKTLKISKNFQYWWSLATTHPGHIYYKGSWYRTPFIWNFLALYHRPNIKSSHEIWIEDSFGHFLGWKMPKMVNFAKIRIQISGQWFELGGWYFEVKISSTKASIGDFNLENCFHWTTLI